MAPSRPQRNSFERLPAHQHLDGGWGLRQHPFRPGFGHPGLWAPQAVGTQAVGAEALGTEGARGREALGAVWRPCSTIRLSPAAEGNPLRWRLLPSWTLLGTRKPVLVPAHRSDDRAGGPGGYRPAMSFITWAEVLQGADGSQRREATLAQLELLSRQVPVLSSSSASPAACCSATSTRSPLARRGLQPGPRTAADLQRRHRLGMHGEVAILIAKQQSQG